MYSCADSKETRENQLQMLLGGETQGLKEDCQRETPSLMMVYRKLGQVERSVDARQADVPIQYVGPEYLEEATETTTEETPSEFVLWYINLLLGYFCVLCCAVLSYIMVFCCAVICSVTMMCRAVVL